MPDTSATSTALPLKTVGSFVLVADVGEAKDAQQIQNNIVRVDGQPSVYLPVLKQGGDTNTIAVVDGIKEAVPRSAGRAEAAGRPRWSSTSRVFVKNAIENLLHEGAHRLGPDRADDPDLSRQHARDRGGVPFDSALGAGDRYLAVRSAAARSTP